MLTKEQQLTCTVITLGEVDDDSLGDFINGLESIPPTLRRELANRFDDLVDRLTDAENEQECITDELAELRTTLCAIREAGGW